MTKKRNNRSSGVRRPGLRLTSGRRLDILGIILVSAALLTLLSLISLNRGLLTEGWINALRLGLGIGIYLFPLGLGAFGMWLVLRADDEEKPFDWEKPAGVGLLYLVAITGAHLVASAGMDSQSVAAQGSGGGYLGWALRAVLVGGLGLIGSWVVLVALFFVSLILILDVTLAEFARLLGACIRRWLAHLRSGDDGKIPIGSAAEEGPASVPSSLPPGSQGPNHHATTLPSPPTAASDPLKDVSIRGRSSSRPPEAEGRDRGKSFGRLYTGEEPRLSPDDSHWTLPPIQEIFEESTETDLSPNEVRDRVRIIEETLNSFGVPARVVEVNQGPAVTQFGVAPGFIEKREANGRIKRAKVKVSRIAALSKDLALALAASPIRIEAPVPGRPIVGIEVPNSSTAMVSLRGVMESEGFLAMRSPLRIALGQDVSGQSVSADLASMPHLLIAGATGSGKSVCINAIVACLLTHSTPRSLRMLMIDPKRVELISYNGVSHLITPVVVDLERVVGALQWATREMDRRYNLFARAGVRNLEGYNRSQAGKGEPELPLLVIVIDELADLMMVAPDEVERSICRIAQMARATGIHLIIATQRPSVDVVTGLIKANFPARIAFAVTSQVDSRVILDVAGAEQLLGRGDMLYMAPDSAKLKRLQGCFVSDRELHRLVRYWKGMHVIGDETPGEVIQPPLWEELEGGNGPRRQRDGLWDEAVKLIQEQDRASISMLQRRLRIGYSRAARLIDHLEEEGYVGPEEGSLRTRSVLVRKDSETNAGQPPSLSDTE